MNRQRRSLFVKLSTRTSVALAAFLAILNSNGSQAASWHSERAFEGLVPGMQAITPPKHSVSETVVAELAGFDPGSLRICHGSTGDRIAFAHRRDTAWFVTVDGVANGPFEQVSPDSDNGQPRFALMPGFSRDCRRFAYLAKQGGLWHVIADGVRGPGYPLIVKASNKGYAGFALFDPDTHELAYTGMDSGQAWHLLVEHVVHSQLHPLDPGRWTGEELRSSPPAWKRAGQPEAIAGHKAEIVHRGNERFVVVDGIELKHYRVRDAGNRVIQALEVLTMSPVGPIVEAGSGDGPVPPVLFDPTGKRTAYLVRSDGKTIYVVDEVEYGPFKERNPGFFDNFAARCPCRPIVFGPDGSHFAFASTRDDRTLVFVDGIEGPALEIFGYQRKGVWVKDLVSLPLRFVESDRLETYKIKDDKLIRVSVNIQDVH